MSITIKIKKNALSDDEKNEIIKDLTISITKGKNTENFVALDIQEYKEKYFKLTIPFSYGIQKFDRKNTILLQKKDFKVILRDYQEEIIAQSLSQLSKSNCTTIEIPPGRGKTILGIYLSLCIDLFPVVIVVPSNISSLPEQWKKTLLKFGVEEDDIRILDEPKKEKNVNYSKFKFVICQDSRVKCFLNSPSNLDKSLFQTLIIDEAHLLCTQKKLFSVFFNIQPKYIITLSATIERSDNLHTLLHLISGKESIKRSPIIPFDVIVQKTPNLGIKLSFNKKTGRMDFLKYCQDLSANEEYNKVIINIVKNNSHRKFIILTKFVDHALLLESLFKEEKLKVAVLCGKHRKHNDENILIGTIPKLSTGYDAENAAINYSGCPPDALILSHPIKQYQLFEQCKGRVMRTSIKPIVWWLELPDLTFSIKHLNGLREYIKNCNGTIIS